MADDDIFVKRVDFEVNNNQTTPIIPTNINGNAIINDIEKSNEPEAAPSCTTKFCIFLEKFGIKSALSHIGLLLSLGLFCYGGGWVFVTLERPALEANEAELRASITIAREKFIEVILDAHTEDYLDIQYLTEQLEEYEQTAQDAVEGNLQLVFEKSNDTEVEKFPAKGEKWSIMQAVFFAATVCTTIGYGNIVPATFEGRLFCIFFAIIGIPFTLTVIADYGNLFANSVSWIAKRCKSMKMCNKDSKIRKFKGRKWLYAIGAVIFLGIYISAGAAVFDEWEEGWTFFDGFYFCFITVTTVGFGDLVPGEYLMLLCTVYILIGLALTSTIIELVRRQYIQSWQKLQQMKLGSFADSLKRLGEAHGAIDVNDLRSILSVVSMPKRDKKDKKNSEGEVDTLEELTKAILREVKVKQIEKPKLVQIIIYESSV
ncbi:CLUMA_CG004127, isoform A [Clunio marinus]|uniref:CLUMA_CG004127, isoform A n=1 Tax=Clunio marinus TaxID=568069 RepID=A0A1J1HR05_9DIPT|nr:CLUMA_CG004127, isoform A [Clunio marinus]